MQDEAVARIILLSSDVSPLTLGRGAMTPDQPPDTAVQNRLGITVFRGNGLTRAWNGIRYKTGSP